MYATLGAVFFFFYSSHGGIQYKNTAQSYGDQNNVIDHLLQNKTEWREIYVTKIITMNK